ncbi:hypothetical protein [Streptomyces sp. LN500]|uniref:hypothetical protein n=1 Tax=Streptomyces sp. LN500 TaxID=3112978 RepID=UPI00371E0488
MTTVCIEIHTVTAPRDGARAPQRKLVSIGMASADGRRFYAVNSDVPFELCLTQLPQEAIDALPTLRDPVRLDWDDPDVIPMEDIKAGFETFIGQTTDPQFWSADGNSDFRDMRSVFDYYTELLYPPGFPHWISSVREQFARILDSIGHRDPERLHQLQASGVAEPSPLRAQQQHAFKDAHRTLRALQKAERVAVENGVDTTLREPAWLDWKHVWAPDTAVYVAPRPSDGLALGRQVAAALRRTQDEAGAA